MSVIAKLEKSFIAAHDRRLAQDFPRTSTNNSSVGTKIPHWKRIRDAALSNGNEAAWNVVADCRVRSYCHSTYCRDCRSRGAESHSRRILKLHREIHGDDEAYARRNLRFATVLCALVPLNTDAIQASIDQAKKTLKAIRRSFPGLGTHGRFELEVIDMVAIASGVCPRKKQVMDYLNRDDLGSLNNDRVLVHFHVVLFLNGNDDRKVLAAFNGKWSGTYRVRIDTFHTTKSVEDSIKKLCSYMLKNRVTYNHTMTTNGYNGGRYIKDSSLSFLLTMSNMYDDNDLLIYSKDTM